MSVYNQSACARDLLLDISLQTCFPRCALPWHYHTVRQWPQRKCGIRAPKGVCTCTTNKQKTTTHQTCTRATNTNNNTKHTTPQTTCFGNSRNESVEFSHGEHQKSPAGQSAMAATKVRKFHTHGEHPIGRTTTNTATAAIDPNMTTQTTRFGNGRNESAEIFGAQSNPKVAHTCTCTTKHGSAMAATKVRNFHTVQKSQRVKTA